MTETIELRLFEDNEITLNVEVSGNDPQVRETSFRFFLEDPVTKQAWLFFPKHTGSNEYRVTLPKGPYSHEKDKIFSGTLEAMVGKNHFIPLRFLIRFVSPVTFKVSTPIVKSK